MLRRVVSFAVLVVFSLSFAGIARADGARATGKALLGVWKIKSMESAGKKQEIPAGMTLTMEFKTSGALVMVIKMGEQKQEEKATWEVKGSTLKVTDPQGRVSEMEFQIKGSALTLHEKTTKDIMYLVR